ncbi:MAG: hypothetical protein ACE5GH_03940, partial [Fidelibacterota bacterium]
SQLDTTSAAVGDVLHFQVWARGSGGKKVQFPDLAVDVPDIVVGQRKELEGDQENDRGVQFEVTFWDTGTFTLPSYPVNVLTEHGETVDYSLTTDPVTLIVRSVISDPQPRLRDIKPPVPIPLTVPVRLLASVGSIVLLSAVLVWAWRKRVPDTVGEPIPTIPTGPPYDIAMEKLAELRNHPLSTRSQIKEFYARLSYIVREYLEHQYFLRAVEMTTEEIEQEKVSLPLSSDLLDHLVSFLKRADLAKFAKFQPGTDECMGDLEGTEDFIRKTRLDWSVGQESGESVEVS